jgi:hypothetical protein
MMGGRERRRGRRRNSRRGGPPWQATRSSPERSVRALRSTVRRTEGTGVTRGRWRPRWVANLDQRRPDATLAMADGGRNSPVVTAMALKTTKQEREAWGDRGEHGVAHHGKKEDGDGAETVNREEWRTADFGGALWCGFHGRGRGERQRGR